MGHCECMHKAEPDCGQAMQFKFGSWPDWALNTELKAFNTELNNQSSHFLSTVVILHTDASKEEE